jgi:hypothetical protein
MEDNAFMTGTKNIIIEDVPTNRNIENIKIIIGFIVMV